LPAVLRDVSSAAILTGLSSTHFANTRAIVGVIYFALGAFVSIPALHGDFIAYCFN